MALALTRPGYPHQLSLLIMRKRAEAIKDIVAAHVDMYELWAAELTLAERLAENGAEMPDQLAALFWQGVWERLMGRTDSWCVMCSSDLHDTCPVRAVLYQEARRVNAP
jgi:hypothetical protein